MNPRGGPQGLNKGWSQQEAASLETAWAPAGAAR